MVKLKTVTIVRAPMERCFDLARSVEVHLVGNVHWGETAVASAGVTSGLVGLGERVTWRAKHFWAWHQLTSEITAMEGPAFFQDVQVAGIFRSMRHDHFFRELPSGGTEMRDVFCIAAPLPVLGRIAEVTFLGRYMKALLEERNAALKRIAESEEWRRYL